jgi:hypothetical protein
MGYPTGERLGVGMGHALWGLPRKSLQLSNSRRFNSLLLDSTQPYMALVDSAQSISHYGVYLQNRFN